MLTTTSLLRRDYDFVTPLELLDDTVDGADSKGRSRRLYRHTDRRFIADIPHDRDDMEIASAVIAMGHSLRIQVLAEGVETPAQLEFLRLRGCDRYQGFVYGHPLDPEAFAHLLGREQQAVRGDAFCCAGAGI